MLSDKNVFADLIAGRPRIRGLPQPEKNGKLKK